MYVITLVHTQGRRDTESGKIITAIFYAKTEIQVSASACSLTCSSKEGAMVLAQYTVQQHGQREADGEEYCHQQ